MRQKCRGCDELSLKKFLDLGFSPPSNSYLDLDSKNIPQIFLPLVVAFCSKCFFVQTIDTVEREVFFSKDYAYFSSVSSSWLSHCEKYAKTIIEQYQLVPGNLVLEIASNDGYLLDYFAKAGLDVLGIEPTVSTAKIAQNKGIATITQFFGSELANKLKTDEVVPNLIIGNNVLAHVPNINDFINGLSILLTNRAIATFEFPHLVSLLKFNQFDTVYHEHYSYLSITSLIPILKRHNLEIFKVDLLSTHGGSLRIYIAKKTADFQRDKSVDEVLKLEESCGINNETTYNSFQLIAEKTKNDFLKFLIEKKIENSSVVGFGAAAKGNTLINFAGVKSDLLDYVVDSSPSKQGLFLPGSAIPIKHPSVLLENKPDCLVILPWNISEEIIEILTKDYQFQGEIWVAIPELKRLK